MKIVKVNVDERVHAQLKAAAALTGMRLPDFMGEALEFYVRGNPWGHVTAEERFNQMIADGRIEIGPEDTEVSSGQT